MKKTALIILNYNNAKCTGDCLKSVMNCNSAPYRLIVVDNNSTPQQQEDLKQRISELTDGNFETIRKGEKSINADFTLVLNDTNAGYASGNNVGIDIAFADPEVEYLMILNNDILFVDDIIPKLIESLEKLPACALASPLLLKRDGIGIDYSCARRNHKVKDLIRQNFLHYWWRFRGKTDADMMPNLFIIGPTSNLSEPMEIEMPSGSCMLISKALMQAIGAFDSHTFLYFEENILYRKLQNLGLKSYLIPSLKCIHLGAQTTASIPDSLFMLTHNLNSQRYYVKNYSGANRWMQFLYSLSAAFCKASFIFQKKLKRSQR